MCEKMEGLDLFSGLPEECVCHIFSFTSPRDACRLSTVSCPFRWASLSDAVWERFLPSDYKDIVSRSDYLLKLSSKKELYLELCRPIPIDNGHMSFSIEKETGKKCFMLSVNELVITWGSTPQYWRRISLPQSRFSEVAELLAVCWLEICGRIDAHLLSPKTTYKAYLVMNIAPDAYGLNYPAVEMSVKVGGHTSNRTAYLKSQKDHSNVLWYHEQLDSCSGDEQVPQARSDGWMEIEMGEFFNDEGEEGDVEMHLIHTKGGHWKKGLIVEGIEIRSSS